MKKSQFAEDQMVRMVRVAGNARLKKMLAERDLVIDMMRSQKRSDERGHQTPPDRVRGDTRPVATLRLPAVVDTPIMTRLHGNRP